MNKLSYPVNNEDLADTKLELELFGSYGYRIEVTESPEKWVWVNKEDKGISEH